MSRILDRITSPTDLKVLTLEELEDLAAEIRETIITTVSRNGGHIAPGPGSGGMALSLHYCLVSPLEKVAGGAGDHA